MTAEEVKALPLTQKIQIMEALWEDLRDRFEQSEVPQRIRDLLDQRRVRVQQGTAKVLDWDAVKSSIGRA
jgi:putative addiction module component (TIGR02574 family)